MRTPSSTHSVPDGRGAGTGAVHSRRWTEKLCVPAEEVVLEVWPRPSHTTSMETLDTSPGALVGAPVRLLEGQLGLSGVLDGVHRVMGRRVDVLLQGESGTGEELVARILHEADPVRASARFVAVNCAALPEGVLEAELFGVCRGAYTGADADRPGLFRLAHGGTLFLDEVGDQPTTLQPKLLRALQERRVRSLGGTEETAVDVRVVSATHLDLALASAESRFRADLYYRLADYVIALPPLRQRRQDILILAERFLHRYRVDMQRLHLCGSTPEARSWLRRQDWRGNNVRELDVIVKRVVLQCDDEWVGVDDLRRATGESLPVGSHVEERVRMEEALHSCSGYIAATARELGLKRSTLFDRLRRHQIDLPRTSGKHP